MNAPPSPTAHLIPESAPFSDEQRAWLNGFFAGFVALDLPGGVVALTPQQNAALMPGADAGPLADGDDGETPWHDQTLPLAERMALAKGRPLRRRMMAAMAQQDCGQCGYNCADYADKIFLKEEGRLNLCVPGGKETARMLKSLYEELGSAAVSKMLAAMPAAPSAGPTRDNPATVHFVSRTRLNKGGSEKKTWHLEFDLAGSGCTYAAGDSFGLYPRNDPALADTILARLGFDGTLMVGARTLRDLLIEDVSLSPAPDSLFQLLSYITGGERRQKAKALASGEDPDGDAATLDVLAAIEKFEGAHPDPEAFVEALEPLQPRLYSISSSPRTHAERLSLTVDVVRYDIGRRLRKGVASTYLAERAQPGDTVRAYVQKAHGFALPADPAVPIIMIGPGTGIAPFRAFLHERMATKAPGRNWLFFGHQRSAHDFFYADELNAMKTSGLLTRLSLAWSRDGDRKFYVQDRMREVGRDLWAWLAEGAHVYVCGDARRMAKDVERALVDIVAQFGARSTDEAIAFVAELKKRGRYQQDAY